MARSIKKDHIFRTVCSARLMHLNQGRTKSLRLGPVARLFSRSSSDSLLQFIMVESLSRYLCLKTWLDTSWVNSPRPVPTTDMDPIEKVNAKKG